MGVQTVLVKTCDRCGDRMHELSRAHPEAGELTLQWHGSQSAIGYDDAAGGINRKGEKLLCLRCLREFFSFIEKRPAAPTEDTQ